jgi:chromosome segregation ATPase
MTRASLIKKIEKLENEFKANDTKIQEIRTANNGRYSELFYLQNRQREINDELHELDQQLWAMDAEK